MKTIIHIFSAKTTHHISSILKNFEIYLLKDKLVKHIIYLHEYEKYKQSYTDFLIEHPAISINNFETPKDLNNLIRNLDASDKIIVHGFFIKKFWMKFIFLSNTDLKKIIWVCWGSGGHLLKGFKNYPINLFRKYIFKKLHTIIALISSDYDEIKDDFNCSNVELSPYFSRIWDFANNEMFLDTIPYIQRKEIVNVKVGNSASSTNQHAISFKLLERFKNQSINIIAPLAYGPEKYKNEIIRLGNETFGKSFVEFTEFLPQDEYAKYLSNNTDILVYHADTQTGLFNVYFAIYCGKKIYANGYNYEWVSSMGIKINHVNELEKITYEEFIKPLTIIEIQRNRQFLKNNISSEVTVPRWKKLLYE